MTKRRDEVTNEELLGTLFYAILVPTLTLLLVGAPALLLKLVGL